MILGWIDWIICWSPCQLSAPVIRNVFESLKASALCPSGVFHRTLRNVIDFGCFWRPGNAVRGSKLSLDYCKGRIYFMWCNVMIPVASELQLPWSFLAFPTFAEVERVEVMMEHPSSALRLLRIGRCCKWPRLAASTWAGWLRGWVYSQDPVFAGEWECNWQSA